MLKRFTIGFVLGLGMMYYYLFHVDETVTGAKQWGNKAAEEYRGDERKSLADDLLKKKQAERAR